MDHGRTTPAPRKGFRKGTPVIRARFAQHRNPNKGNAAMWLAIALVLLVLWLLGAFAFKAAGFLIHLLLIFVVISVVMHFVRRAA